MIEPELLEALARAAKSEQVRSRQDASSRDAQQRPWASAQSKQRRDQLAKRREARTCLFKYLRMIVVSGVTTVIDPV